MVLVLSYMWTLPDLQGGSLKWALNFLLKHTTFYQSFEISLIWIKNCPIYYIHFDKPPWNKRKISLVPFWNLSHACTFQVVFCCLIIVWSFIKTSWIVVFKIQCQNDFVTNCYFTRFKGIQLKYTKKSYCSCALHAVLWYLYEVASKSKYLEWFSSYRADIIL